MNRLNLWGRVALAEEEIEKLTKQMSTIQSGFNDLSAAVTALQAEDAVVVAAIKALQAQVAAGTPVTGAQLEALAQAVTGVTSDLATAVGTATSTGTATSS